MSSESARCGSTTRLVASSIVSMASGSSGSSKATLMRSPCTSNGIARVLRARAGVTWESTCLAISRPRRVTRRMPVVSSSALAMRRSERKPDSTRMRDRVPPASTSRPLACCSDSSLMSPRSSRNAPSLLSAIDSAATLTSPQDQPFEPAGEPGVRQLPLRVGGDKNRGNPRPVRPQHVSEQLITDHGHLAFRQAQPAQPPAERPEERLARQVVPLDAQRVTAVPHPIAFAVTEEQHCDARLTQFVQPATDPRAELLAIGGKQGVVQIDEHSLYAQLAQELGRNGSHAGHCYVRRQHKSTLAPGRCRCNSKLHVGNGCFWVRADSR